MEAIKTTNRHIEGKYLSPEELRRLRESWEIDARECLGWAESFLERDMFLGIASALERYEICKKNFVKYGGDGQEFQDLEKQVKKLQSKLTKSNLWGKY